MAKVFQIEHEICYYDASGLYSSVSQTIGRYPPSVLFVEAPDYVFEGWGYDSTKEGDERFIQPTPPDGFAYDPEYGGFYPIGQTPPSQMPTEEERIQKLESQLAETDEAAIELYEAMTALETVNAEQDEAIIEIYELMEVL